MTRLYSKWHAWLARVVFATLLSLAAVTGLAACDGCEDPRDVPEPEVVPNERAP